MLYGSYVHKCKLAMCCKPANERLRLRQDTAMLSARVSPASVVRKLCALRQHGWPTAYCAGVQHSQRAIDNQQVIESLQVRRRRRRRRIQRCFKIYGMNFGTFVLAYGCNRCLLGIQKCSNNRGTLPGLGEPLTIGSQWGHWPTRDICCQCSQPAEQDSAVAYPADFMLIMGLAYCDDHDAYY
jgi:hypothetical protein